MVELANTIWADGPTSAPSQPPKAQLRQWGTFVESLMTLAYTNGKVYSSRSALNADLTPGANTPALVIGDPNSGFDGLYMKVGATTTGSWTQLLNFVPGAQIVHAVDAGAGTPNAIVATTNVALSGTGSQLVRLDIFEANTAAPVTIAFNGGPVLTIKTAAGNNPSVGGLTAGTVLGLVSGSTFRLLSDQASAAIQAAAEAAAISAIASAAAAYQSMVDAAAVSGSGSFTDPDTAFVTSNQTILGDLLRKEIDPVRLGASTSSAVDSAAAIRTALALHRAIPGSKVILRRIFGVMSAIPLLADDVIEGIGREVSGLISIGGGSHHVIYGDVIAPAHRARLANFSVWGKLETVSSGAYDCIRLYNASDLVIDNLGSYDGDALCVRLVDCDRPRLRGMKVGSSTDARYIAGEAWGVFLDGCTNAICTESFAYRTGQGFAVNADDSYRRTYFHVSSVANDELTCTDAIFFSNLVTGDEVRMFTMDGVGVVPGGTTEQQIYYAIKTGTDSDLVIKLAATYADAIAGTPVVDITSAGSGTTRVSRDNVALFQMDKPPASRTATFDNTTDTILVDAAYYLSFTTGVYPMYAVSNGTLPTGVSADQIYWAARIGGNTLRLYDSQTHAVTNDGTTGRILFSDNGTGTHQLRLAKVSTFTRSSNDIILEPWLYELVRTGDPVQFKSLGGSPPAPFAANTDYYVIRSATDRYIKLATTAANARAGTSITITTAGTGTQYCVLNMSTGADQTDSISRRPASEARGNRYIGCTVDRFVHHAFNINSGSDCGFIGCTASRCEEFATNMGGGAMVQRPAFQAKHSSGVGSDRNFFIGCHVIRGSSGFQAQETKHTSFIDCTVDDMEWYGIIINSADDVQVQNFTSNRTKKTALWGISSPRIVINGFQVEAHPNGTSTLLDLDSSSGCKISSGQHQGVFAFVFDLDSGSGGAVFGKDLSTRGLPINIVPVTCSYPITMAKEIDMTVAAVHALGQSTNGLHVARVSQIAVVAATGQMRVGRSGSTAQFVAAGAVPTAALSVANAVQPSGIGWVSPVSQMILAEVTTVGTGKIWVELGGFPTS
ncbi:right-handed parallel beta-helix repeat-containing protein [Mesorhizobium sp. M0578]|uniref:right-handed parallel beta-helix repeat-containing protein n=1 Tax=unclassified Mesorhizobium TaxID=325217 RepID=UPI003335120A